MRNSLYAIELSGAAGNEATFGAPHCTSVRISRAKRSCTLLDKLVMRLWREAKLTPQARSSSELVRRRWIKLGELGPPPASKFRLI